LDLAFAVAVETCGFGEGFAGAGSDCWAEALNPQAQARARRQINLRIE
jgi:hypothetical protein